MSDASSPTTTIRLSLTVLCIGILLLFIIGMAGGYIGYRLAPAPITFLPNGDRTIVPVSQQVTISPSKAGEDIVATQGKSVLLLVEQTPKGIVARGNGVILTNDGVVLALEQFPNTALSAVLEDGSLASLTHIGDDVLSGITFFRIPDQILPPVTLAQSAPRAGSEVMSVVRDQNTMRPTASRHTIAAITALEEKHALGIQQVALLSGGSLPLAAGTALFNDDGRLVGVAREGENPTMLLVPDITAALSRLSANTLAQDPFTTVGFTVTWKLEQDSAGVFGMRAVVSQVIPKSPAFDAGIKAGDVLTSSNGNSITWDSALSDALMKTPLTLSLTREGEERTVQIP